MKRFRRFLTGIMVALGVLSVGSIASAEEFMDLTPLFGNVNVAVPGVEVIMPLIQVFQTISTTKIQKDFILYKQF